MDEQLEQLPDASSTVIGADAFWTTFWNLNQFWRLAPREITNQWVRPLLEIYRQGG
jgi:hypothetical protein